MRATDWNPNPPRVAGRPAFAKPARASGAGAPAMQARNAASCAAAYPAASVGGDGAQGEVGSMRRAEGEEQPGVGECRGVRAASVSLSLLHQHVRPREDEGRMPDGHAENNKAAFMWRLGTSQHIRTQVGHLGGAGTFIPAEHPCVAVVSRSSRLQQAYDARTLPLTEGWSG